MNTELALARRLADAAESAGGRAYFVGGCVRDALLGREPKDVDVEVHGLTPGLLEGILDTLGERFCMGASFGVYSLRHTSLDISMPRSEAAPGRGGRDFSAYVDPFIGTQKAAMRRDFTINAMMQDILTGELLDPFGGMDDLCAGVIRHVSDRTFSEDPLRVLRAAQFAARFGFSIAPETLSLCASLDLSALARERVMEETSKALLRADRPSVFFDTLRAMRQLDFWFPEIHALCGVLQEPRWHPEGDVFAHTLLVLDQAAGLRAQAEDPQGLMFSALCHDLGKPETTQRIDGRIRSIGHEQAGVPLARRLLGRLTGDIRLSRYVSGMVLLHMRPNMLAAMGSGTKAYRKLFSESENPGDLLLLAQADALGSGGAAHDYAPVHQKLLAELDAYHALLNMPSVTGEDLIREGMQPGTALGEALAYAHALHLKGVPKAQALPQTLAYIRHSEKK